MTDIPGPFAHPDPSLPIREGAPPLQRPTREEVARFPTEARQLIDRTASEQAGLLQSGGHDLSWLEGRHVLIAGATGPGIGGALAVAALKHAKPASLTIVARDLSRSLGYETGKLLQSDAEGAGWGPRFHWINDGMAVEGPALDAIVTALREAAADNLVYFNTVAAANSGLQPGMPPIFVKDYDDTGLFQWQLSPLAERELAATSFVMGEMAVRFPEALATHDISVDVSVFADWRGSLDRLSRDPAQRAYGRQGAYSTSLFVPKDILQQAVREAYGSDRLMLDIFYPMMRTRALPFIPGGLMTASVNDTLMRRESIEPRTVPRLALMALDRVGASLVDPLDNPFPRLDDHDAHLDVWLYEVMARLNNHEDSDFYYLRWL